MTLSLCCILIEYLYSTFLSHSYFHQIIWLLTIAHWFNLSCFCLTEDFFHILLGLTVFQPYATSLLTILVNICEVLASLKSSKSSKNVFFLLLINWRIMNLSLWGDAIFFFLLVLCIVFTLLTLRRARDSLAPIIEKISSSEQFIFWDEPSLWITIWLHSRLLSFKYFTYNEL